MSSSCQCWVCKPENADAYEMRDTDERCAVCLNAVGTAYPRVPAVGHVCLTCHKTHKIRHDPCTRLPINWCRTCDSVLHVYNLMYHMGHAVTQNGKNIESFSLF
jgi:hypothetical protein